MALVRQSASILDQTASIATESVADPDLHELLTVKEAAQFLKVPVSWIYHARGVQGISRRLQEVRMDLRGEMATLVAWRLDLAPRSGS